MVPHAKALQGSYGCSQACMGNVGMARGSEPAAREDTVEEAAAEEEQAEEAAAGAEQAEVEIAEAETGRLWQEHLVLDFDAFK